MLSLITPYADALGIDPRTMIMVGLFLGSLLVFLSLVNVMRDRNAARVQARMQAAGARGGAGASAGDMSFNAPISHFVAPEVMPGGLAKAFLPSDMKERNKVRQDLAHAGFTGPNAVLWYFGLRVGVGLLLPALIAIVFLYREVLPLPGFVSERLNGVRNNHLLVLFGVMILVGFYGPAIWLSSRVSERRQRIELAFPNALDLLQVSIETGLGFDAALSRVATELHRTAPEIAREFNVAQQEILAGRERDDAYHAMANRLAIEEAHAFVNVVLQSARFGTSMSQALLVYSAEMRQRRELRAQEKANKLPVLMSGVMASMMMPALLIVTIGPVALRYMESFPKGP
jgi:tight adherence protein C